MTTLVAHNFRFKIECQLRKHSSTHTDSKFKCDKCEKTFHTKQSLKKHLEIHSGFIARPFKCEFCSTGFRRNVDLKVICRPFYYTFQYLCTFSLRTGSSTHSYRRKTILVHRRTLWVEFPSEIKLLRSYAQSARFVKLKLNQFDKILRLFYIYSGISLLARKREKWTD